MKIHYWTFAKVKVTQNVAQYPLHHVTYFEVATSNGFGGDPFTKNLRHTYVRTHRQTDSGPTLVRN